MGNLHLKKLKETLKTSYGEIRSDIWCNGRNVFYPPARQNSPSAVVKPTSLEVLSNTLKWASNENQRILVKAGGHSLDGFCCQNNTVMIDLTEFNSVKLCKNTKKLIVQPSATNSQIAKCLAETQLFLPTGDCPSVAMGGQLLGGGFSYHSRATGLCIDHLTQVRLMTVSGDLLIADQYTNKAMFCLTVGKFLTT